MTVAGAICSVTGDAIVWIDDLVSQNGGLTRSRSKLAINPLIGAVGVGAGWWRVAREGYAAVHDASDFDGLVSTLPSCLQRANARCAEGHSEFAVIGFSHALDRLIACLFTDDDDFAPHYVTRWGSPDVPELDNADSSLWAAIEVARAQQAVLGRAEPPMPAGLLTLARIGPHGIAVRPAFDLATGELIAGSLRRGRASAQTEAAA